MSRVKKLSIIKLKFLYKFILKIIWIDETYFKVIKKILKQGKIEKNSEVYLIIKFV